MEELRSTEILDREILEDARKKAEKALKAADAECARIGEESLARLEETKKEREAEYARALEAYRADALASIPLERQRRLVARIDGAVRDSLESWFTSLPAERRLSIYGMMMKRSEGVFGTQPVRARVAGYTVEEATGLLAGVFGKNRIAELSVLSEGEARLAGFVDGLLLDNPDRSTLCRVTKRELFEELLCDRRQELADSLFGGRLPE